MENNRKPMFSILMCVYNQIELLENAIQSVLCQNETKWELLILDNSDYNQKATLEILRLYEKNDSRVRIFSNVKNIGWAKGTSYLIKQALGTYMTFLAADDFLLPDVLDAVKKKIEQEEPDIIWVGNGFYQYENNKLSAIGKSFLSMEKTLIGKNASHIKYVMENVFYNSMFHYEKIDFLKKNNIDFYEPYYGDCVGMTKAMVEAEKMVFLDIEAYGLVHNTSQTRGKFFWDGINYIFIPQWNCIKNAFVRDGYFSFQDARFCAIAVLKAITGCIVTLLNGAVCIDRKMNPVHRNLRERMVQIEEILQHPAVQEMIQFYGRYEYEKEILTILFGQYVGLERSEEVLNGIQLSQGWLGMLLKQNQIIQCKSCEEVIGIFVEILMDEANIGMMGMGLFLQYVNSLSDEAIKSHIDIVQKILQTYESWKHLFVEKVYFEFQRNHALEGQSRIEIAAFCKYILEN